MDVVSIDPEATEQKAHARDWPHFPICAQPCLLSKTDGYWFDGDHFPPQFAYKDFATPIDSVYPSFVPRIYGEDAAVDILTIRAAVVVVSHFLSFATIVASVSLVIKVDSCPR